MKGTRKTEVADRAPFVCNECGVDKTTAVSGVIVHHPACALGAKIAERREDLKRRLANAEARGQEAREERAHEAEAAR